jgi:ferredoxin-type protein NapF
MVIRPSHIRWLVFGLAILFSLPLLGAPFLGVYLWMSPYLMFNAVLSGKSLVWLHLLGVAALAATVLKKRWICRYACPAGVICDTASGLGRKKAGIWKLRLNRYLAVFAFGSALLGLPVLMVLDPFNLFFMAFEGTRTGMGAGAVVKLSGLVFLMVFSLIFPGTWCASVCPLGGVQLLTSDLKKLFINTESNKTFRPDRRVFLAGFSGVLGGVLMSRVWPQREKVPIRPPHALTDAELNAACIRCGSCSSACPTRIIGQSLDTRHPQRLLTPVVRFKDSYCLPTCNDCGTVCPSGALRPFSLKEKKHLVMGRAVIAVDDCYLAKGKECNQCRHYCEFDAIEMKTGPGTSRLPHLLKDRCVGCGACQVVCPPQVIQII